MTRSLAAYLFAGIAAFCFTAPAATAQETVMVAGVEATRVVIAPPQNDLARLIRDGVSARYAAAGAGTRAHRDAQQLYYFYGGRHFEPLWLTEAPDGRVAFSEVAAEVLEVFENAHLEGLDPADYLTDDLRLTGNLRDPARLAALETAFSDAALRFAQHMTGGRLDPHAVHSLIDVTPPQVDAAQLLPTLAASAAPAEYLLSLGPSHREFRALREALHRHYAGQTEEAIVVADGPLLRPGMSDPRVPDLRRRLELPAAFGDPLFYDEVLVGAVRTFQEGLGLTVDGVVGPATVAALNGGTAAAPEDIIANMERWRWMPRELGDFHVFVNIPEFRLAVMRGDEITYGTRVIVGTNERKTPVFSDMIRHIVVNPYWNVPSGIARNDIEPRVRANPGYLASQNMELLYNGQPINAYSVNWATTSLSNFRVRQRPGPNNSLGQVKFLFPNVHDVYLHDTPSKYLFDRSVRAFSSGCVRVEDPFAFADALLANEPNLSRASLEAMFGPSERWVNPETQIPVHLAYFTLRVGTDGSIRSYGDVYGHHDRVKQMLGLV